MIIFMKNGDMKIAKELASELSAFGNVQIKPANGDGKIILAVLSISAERLNLEDVEKMVGVESCQKSNEFFVMNHQYFQEAYQVFAWGH